MRIDFWQINNVQLPHEVSGHIYKWKIVPKLTTINYASSHFQFSISWRKYNLFALRKQRRAYMFCKHWLTFPRKGHVGLVQNKTKQAFISEQEQSYSITAIEHTLSWTYSSALLWLTGKFLRDWLGVFIKWWEIMSEHSIKCCCDGLLLYDTRLCSLEWPDMAIYIWRIYTPACVKLTATRLLNSFRNPCQCFTLWPGFIRRGWDLFSNQILLSKSKPFLGVWQINFFTKADNSPCR